MTIMWSLGLPRKMKGDVVFGLDPINTSTNIGVDIGVALLFFIIPPEPLNGFFPNLLGHA